MMSALLHSQLRDGAAYVIGLGVLIIALRAALVRRSLHRRQRATIAARANGASR